jgi:rod shape determining protein RodA
LWGKGISAGTQSRLSFLPEADTDFIFSAYGEEWGFIGIIVLFSIFTILIYRLSTTASLGRTNFESLIISGIAIYFFVHFFVHVGINLGIMPVTGTTMPFMSYGGSHLLIEFFALGLVNAVSRTNRNFHRSQLVDTDIIS